MVMSHYPVELLVQVITSLRELREQVLETERSFAAEVDEIAER